MAEISYRRHRFPPVIIQHAVWLYLRFTLSYRDVEELLAERGIDVSYETVRSWVLKFGPIIAAGCGAAPVHPRRSPLRQTGCWRKADSNRWSHHRTLITLGREFADSSLEESGFEL